MRTDRSRKLFARARKVIPGGVSSPVRAFKAVGGTPRFLASGKGAVVTDVDGNRYLDYVGSWGPLILGHAHPVVVKALRAALPKGTSFGAPTELEVEIAELLCRSLPGVQRVRFVNSGTEATMSALRLARAVTGRSRVLKFEGNYHGHVDSLLLGAGSGVATLGIPGTPGVPEETTRLTLQAPYNDLGAVREAFRRHGEEIACVIVEPVAGNMGCVLPEPDFLEGLRKACDEFGALLIFDEVMTGFRVAWGGAQRRYRVKPDLTCLGKVVGGGLPAAAFAGPAKLMDHVAPAGPVYQSGTLSGNPLAMAAGLATLQRLSEPGTYDLLEERSRMLTDGLAELAAEAGLPFTTARAGGMFGFYFHPGPVRSLAEAKQCHEERFRRFFTAMLERGVYLAPSPYEAGFVSLAHRKREVERTLEAAREAFRRAARVR